MNLIGLKKAAAMIGYTEKGLRKIVDRSRAKANGVRTRGPTIIYFQTSKGAPVKFRLEWIEAFVEKYTVDSTPLKPFEYEADETFGLDTELYDA